MMSPGSVGTTDLPTDITFQPQCDEEIWHSFLWQASPLQWEKTQDRIIRWGLWELISLPERSLLGIWYQSWLIPVFKDANIFEIHTILAKKMVFNHSYYADYCWNSVKNKIHELFWALFTRVAFQPFDISPWNMQCGNLVLSAEHMMHRCEERNKQMGRSFKWEEIVGILVEIGF